jgi:GNAT superfamily N-acetyltransferase
VEKVPHPSRTRWERPVGYVTNMYVEPERRRMGFGRALLDAVVAHARERGVDGLMLWPSERSTPFYRRAGFGREGWLWLGIDGD